MDINTQNFYILFAITSVQTLGYFDIRLYYFTVCCLVWQAIRVFTPTWTTNIELQISWYVLKGGTIMMKVCSPLVERVSKPIFSLMQASTPEGRIHLVGADGKIIKTVDVDPPLRPDNFPTIKPEFVIYEWHPKDTCKYTTHCVRFETVEKALASPMNFKLSNIKFLAPTITVWDNDSSTNYDMSPALSTNNYYICENHLFDKPFVSWYLNKHHGVCLANCNYQVNFIDNRMMPQSLGVTQVLVIKRDSYEIVPINNSPYKDTPLRKRTPDMSTQLLKDNEYIKHCKKSLSKVKIDPTAPPSHKLYPWGQYY